MGEYISQLYITQRLITRKHRELKKLNTPKSMN
jgi:hypothetical protein